MKQAHCQLCKQQNWLIFSAIPFGIWDKDSKQLSRQNSNYPLGKCQSCGHVQVSLIYTKELFEKLYFHSSQEAVMWHESLVGSERPYEEMIDFAFNGQYPTTIVDFGCGEGKLLAAAKDIAKQSKLIGIDFNDRFSQQDITYMAFDLNDLSQLSNHLWPDGIDLAMASHVLEHVIDPVSFLAELKARLSPHGKIFIEVPDFTLRHDEKSIGMSNLVNLQHIHYYTRDSLAFAAKQAGLTIVKQAQMTTGYIPRLQMLLELHNASLEEQVPSLFDAADVILHYQSCCRDLRNRLVGKVNAALNEQSKVGLWGIGADFYNMLNEHPELTELIAKGEVVLFDYSLKGKALQRQHILGSDEIPQFNHPVFMTPQLAETRVKMHVISRDWPNVIDPFIDGNA